MPCKCTGSMGMVHADCFRKWQLTRKPGARKHCRHCGDEFDRRRWRKYVLIPMLACFRRWDEAEPLRRALLILAFAALSARRCTFTSTGPAAALAIVGTVVAVRVAEVIDALSEEQPFYIT